MPKMTPRDVSLSMQPYHPNFSKKENALFDISKNSIAYFKNYMIKLSFVNFSDTRHRVSALKGEIHHSNSKNASTC